jgi:4-amino-4-deoxy-L-arabinose transferase-like glycosyltransferase
MNFLIFLGILAVDIVGLICSAIKKVFSKLHIKIFTANCTLHRITAILATVICVLCIYLLTGIFNSGVEKMLAASFILSFFSSVYYLSKANSSNPKLYFYSLLISQAVIGTPILAYLLRNHTYSEISIAVYFSVVFIIIADAVQTFILDKKVTTNGSTEDPVR